MTDLAGLMEVLTRHGVTKLSAVQPAIEAKVRADIMGMLP